MDIPSGTIVFDKGKITAVGADTPIPAGAELSMLRQTHLSRSDQCHSVLGLIEIGAARSDR